MLAASICCHLDRHRSNVVIEICLQPTRGMCLKEDLNCCVRPSGGRPRIATNYFSERFFSDSSFLRFFNFSDQLLPRKRFLRNKMIRRRVFLTTNLEFVVTIRKEEKNDHFFLIIRVGLNLIYAIIRSAVFSNFIYEYRTVSSFNF